MATPRLINTYKAVINGQEVDVKVYSEGKTKPLPEITEYEEDVGYIEVKPKEERAQDLVELLETGEDE